MNKYSFGMIAMAAIVVASNILVQYPLGNWLTYGALSYPVAFLVTDITNRVYGPAAARRVVIVGFIVGVISSFVAAQYDVTTLRIAIASGTAFLAAQLLDIAVFDRFRNREWWRAPLASTLAGSALDTVLFFTIAFAAFLPHDGNTGWANEAAPLLGMGGMAPLWVSLGLADWLVKLSLAIVALIPFRLIVAQLLSRRASV